MKYLKTFLAYRTDAALEATVGCKSDKKLTYLYREITERVDVLLGAKKYVDYRTNKFLVEEPVAKVRARSLDEAVVSLKKKQKEAGESTMWTVYEGKADWMSIRGIVMTVITCKGTILQHFME